MVLTELWISPGQKLRTGPELVKAILAADPSQRMVVHTADKGLLVSPVPVLP